MSSELEAADSRWSLHRLEHLRDLVYELVVRDIKLRYKRSFLGLAWSLVVPLAQLAIFSFVFGTILKQAQPHFTAFLFTGLLPWTWFQSSLLGNAVALSQNKDLLQLAGFPVGIVPVITVTSQFIHFLLALPILFVFLWLDGCPLSVAIVALPLVLFVQFIVTLSLSYFVGPIQMLFHDTQHILNIVLTLLFYMSPIFYDSSAVPEHFMLVYRLNPVVHLLDAYRAILIHGHFPAFAPLLGVSLGAGLLLFLGYRFYMRLHYRLVQEL